MVLCSTSARQSVRKIDLDCGIALFAATPPDQRVHPAISVSRLVGDHLLDLG
jgi:hypothetical protein